MSVTEWSPEEVGQRGEEIFQRKIMPVVANEPPRRFVTIDILSEDYEIGDEHLATVRALRSRRPNGEFYTRRVAFNYVGRMGPRFRPVSV